MSNERDSLTGVEEPTDNPSLLDDDSDWVFAFDDPGPEPDPEPSVSVFDTAPPSTAHGNGSGPTVVDLPPPPGPGAATGMQPAAARRADMSRRERRRRVRLQARKVRRIIRHIEPWSVLKISLIFYTCLWIIVVVAGVMLWSVAVSSGTVDNTENFIEELFALEQFEFNADEIFRGFALGGLVMVIAGTAFNVLLCVLFNLISDLTGGLRMTVIEEESARPVVRGRRQAPPRLKYQKRMQRGL